MQHRMAPFYGFKRCGDSTSTDNSSTDFLLTGDWSTVKLINPTHQLIDHLAYHRWPLTG